MLARITNQPTLSSQLRTSQPSELAWMGILIQSWTYITCDLKVEVIPLASLLTCY